jgi:O-antigen/teichoic acid export membrane protein
VLPAAGSLFFLAGPLVAAWVGPTFRRSVLVAQILAVLVVVRIGEATAATVLKGAGLHKRLAATNLATAIANVALSLALVGPYGLAGVAIGTLVPVTVAAALVVFPTACRRVHLPIRVALLDSVLPALWPAAVMSLCLALTRHLVPASLVAVAAAGAAASLLYFGLLAIAIGSEERNHYVARLRGWLERRRLPVAA